MAIEEPPASGPMFTGLSRLFSGEPEDLVVSIWADSCGFFPLAGASEGDGVRIAPLVDGFFESPEDAAAFSDESLLEEGFEPEGSWDGEGPALGKKDRPARSRETEKLVSDLMHSLKGPIIVYSENWPLPDWIKRDMTMDRMLKLMKDKEPGMATDLEALAYMYSATMEHPLPSDWANIYLWLGAKVLKNHGMKTPPHVPSKLSEDEKRKLKEFKHWLHEHYEKIKAGERKRVAAYPPLKVAS